MGDWRNNDDAIILKDLTCGSRDTNKMSITATTRYRLGSVVVVVVATRTHQ